jgi:hypothetical protein
MVVRAGSLVAAEQEIPYYGAVNEEPVANSPGASCASFEIEFHFQGHAGWSPLVVVAVNWHFVH